MTDELPLSAAIMSDLVAYHDRLARGGDRPIDPRLALARCIEALADSRAAALTIIEGAAELIEADRPDIALEVLRQAAGRYRDTAPGKVN